jgi:hypothetical protein
MQTSLIVVDDFFDDADSVRNAALRLTYPPQQGVFPGRNSVERLTIQGLDRSISSLVGEPVRAVNPLQSHCKCRITLADDAGTGHVHIDPAYWSGILYLSRPEDCRGGTEFFRHKATGTDRAPYDDAEAAGYGFASGREMVNEIIGRDGKNPAAWKPSMTVPMRFNRLVLLRPWLWHTAGEKFGDSMQNGRLVLLFFFESAR